MTDGNQNPDEQGAQPTGEVFRGDGVQDVQRIKSNSIGSEDLETAITVAGCGKFNFGLLLLALPAACTNGFVTGSMSYVIPAAEVDLGLTPMAKALLQSACYAGMISSGFLWGFLSDAFGRKKLLVLGYLLDSCANVLTGLFPILPLMILFKFVSGFVICGPFSIFTAYISEVFLSKRRDTAVLSIGLFSALGQIGLAGLALLIIPAQLPVQFPLRSWQLFQIACCVPSVVSGVGCLLCVESPKFLADKGDQEGALQVCRTIYTINTGNDATSYPVKRLKHQGKKTEKKSRLSRFLEGMVIFRPPYIQKAAIIFLIHFGVASSQNALRLWLPEMLTMIKSSELDAKLGLCPLIQEGNLERSNSTSMTGGAEKVYTEMMIVNFGSVVGHMLFLIIVKYIGKKNMLLCCALISGSCSLAVPFISADLVFIAASFFLAFYNIAIFCDINIVVDIFPTRIRATSVSILMLIARIGILIVNFLIANLIYTYCEYFFYGLAVLSLIIGTLTIFVPQEPVDDASL